MALEAVKRLVGTIRLLADGQANAARGAARGNGAAAKLKAERDPKLSRPWFGQYGDVPLAHDASARFLPALVAFMVYLAVLALTSALVMDRIAERWDQGLAGRLTVQVPPPSESAVRAQDSGGEASADAPSNRQAVDQVVAILVETPGVEVVTPLGDEEIDNLLAPWLGEGAAEQGLPLPSLVAVTFARDNPPDLERLASRLQAAIPGTMVDDHQRWLGSLLDLAGTIQILAMAMVFAVGFTGVVAVIFVTRTGLAIHRQVIELLHLIGAQDAYVARQFQLHALKLGFGGGLVGFLFAVLTLVLFAHLLSRVETALIPSLSLTIIDWASLALVPFIAAGVAMATARVTVLRTLARLP